MTPLKNEGVINYGKKDSVEFEASQKTTVQATMRAISRFSLSQKQKEELCCLLDEEMDKVNIVV